MPEKLDTPQPPTAPVPTSVNLAEAVLGGAGPRGEVAACPTGLADGDAVVLTGDQDGAVSAAADNSP